MKITRTMFCKKCYDNALPKSNTTYVAIGMTKEEFMIRRAVIYEGVTIGFTPHILEFKKLHNNLIVYTSMCGIVGCGVSLSEREDMDYDIICEEQYQHVTSVKEWEVIVSRWKDTDFEI